MNKEFRDFLSNGYLEPVKLPSGEPMIINDVQYYWPTEQGANLAIARFHAITDLARTHEAFRVSENQVQTRQKLVQDLTRRALLTLTSDPETALDCIQEIQRLNEAEIQRAKFGKDIVQVFEVAAIWIISEDESPGRIVPEKHRKKIETWTQYPDLYAFFLNMPVNALYPLSLHFDQDTLTSSANIATKELLDLMKTLTNIESFGFKSETIPYIASRAEILRNVITSTSQQSSDTLKS
ncbi:hypothetical protein [Runella zeae]|uniref:hypothetical protein n=1 Tax=Runella zeae TaxID=94255 RepID=UPI0004119F90|nr:hypothetical protein [Runella zeae]